MEEFIVEKEELHKMFQRRELLDTKKGWYYKGKEVEIVAIHQVEVKYLQDMMNADSYKIRLAQ